MQEMRGDLAELLHPALGVIRKVKPVPDFGGMIRRMLLIHRRAQAWPDDQIEYEARVVKREMHGSSHRNSGSNGLCLWRRRGCRHEETERTKNRSTPGPAYAPGSISLSIGPAKTRLVPSGPSESNGCCVAEKRMRFASPPQAVQPRACGRGARAGSSRGASIVFPAWDRFRPARKSTLGSKMFHATKEKTKNGKITQVIGVVVDVEFEKGNLPAILDALTVQNGDNEACTRGGAASVVRQVYVQLPFQATDGLVRGDEVSATGASNFCTVGDATSGRMFNVVGEPIDGGKDNI